MPHIGAISPLWIFRLLNVVLFLFNLIPIAPLDGSAVVGSFVPSYRSFLRKPENAKYAWMAFGLVFLLAGVATSYFVKVGFSSVFEAFQTFLTFFQGALLALNCYFWGFCITRLRRKINN